jgi:hypothetical protein
LQALGRWKGLGLFEQAYQIAKRLASRRNDPIVGRQLSISLDQPDFPRAAAMLTEIDPLCGSCRQTMWGLDH